MLVGRVVTGIVEFAFCVLSVSHQACYWIIKEVAYCNQGVGRLKE